ncbi:MAG: glycosyltransferase family 4 protein [Candidatus Poribacteria bacterium]
MRHLLWVNGWPDLGGAERAQLTFFRAIRQKHKITAVFSRGVSARLTDAARELDIEYWTAPLTQLRQTMRPDLLVKFGLNASIANFKFFGFLRHTKIDLIHFAHLYDLPFCALAAFFKRTPLVWMVENPERFNKINVPIINTSFLDGIAGTSTAILEDAFKHGVKARHRKLIPNPYDEQLYWCTERSSIDTNHIKIGFAGVLTDRKGVAELCQAFVVLRKLLNGRKRVLLVVAGDGSEEYKAELKRILKEDNALSDVLFNGFIDSTQAMREFYHGIDLFVMLSKKEGMSVAMLEAMACGCAAAILAPWCDDVIEDGVDGIRLTSIDPKSVADRLLPYIINDDKRIGLGQKAAIKMRNSFSSVAIAKQILEFYSKITGKDWVI